MPLLPFGSYAPDVSDYETQTTSRNILNAVPRGDGWGPFPAFSTYSQALPAACRGAFYAIKSDGSPTVFAGTSTRLYQLSNTDFSWTDVSKSGAAYSDLTVSDQWQFVQFNNYVIAVQPNTVPQVFDLTSSTAFADLGGSPPQARYISVVGRFLVLSGLLSYPYRVQWSGLNAVTTWTSGVNSSDYQDLPDGGVVRGVAGGEYGLILQDQAIRRMTFAPGSPVIFQIERVAQDKGLYAPFSIVRAGERVFFHSAQGFQMVMPGSLPEPIGREMVDRTFFADLDKGNLQLFMGASDPRNSRVFWAYKSTQGTASLFDKMIGYDYALNKWFRLSFRGEFFFGMSQPGLTLENLDSIQSNLELFPYSFDNIATSVTPELAQFDSTHKLGFYRGDNLEATLETGEQGTDGQRIFVRGFRPITDAATLYGSASYRETQADSASSLTEVARNTTTGRCDLLRSTRYSRMKVRIPSGTSWAVASGVEPDIVPEGLQ